MHAWIFGLLHPDKAVQYATLARIKASEGTTNGNGSHAAYPKPDVGFTAQSYRNLAENGFRDKKEAAAAALTERALA